MKKTGLMPFLKTGNSY